MDKFRLTLSPAATKDLDQLDDATTRMILDALPHLEDNPFPRGKRVKKLKGTKTSFYRLRVDKYRIFYIIEGKNVVILKVVGKKDADKFIKNL